MLRSLHKGLTLFLSANHLAVECGNPVLVAGRSRNVERLHACADLLFEDDVAVEVHEPEHAASLALDGNPTFIESVEVQPRSFLMEGSYNYGLHRETACQFPTDQR